VVSLQVLFGAKGLSGDRRGLKCYSVFAKNVSVFAENFSVFAESVSVFDENVYFRTESTAPRSNLLF
jgi:hypothetical protein